MKTDIIIIGAGPGGYSMALDAAKKGMSVTLFEKNALGGTCLNRGCIPTKALCRSAEIVDEIRNSSSLGINHSDDISIDFSEIINRKNQIVEQLCSGIGAMLGANSNIKIVVGEATIVDSKTVECNSERYECDNMVIATGSQPKYLNIEGAHLPFVLSSDEILDLKEMPKRLCVIGGGVIGVEFASIFNSLGCEVTVVEFCKEIIPNFDNEISKRLKQLLSRKGIKIITGAAVKAIINDEGVHKVQYGLKDKQQEVEVDLVLMAVGRGIVLPKGFEKLEAQSTNKGIVVDDNACTSVPGVYAIGDVNGRCMLAHYATFQGKRALNHISNIKDTIDFSIVPSAVFTQPEVAMVGLTEEMCKQKELNYSAKKSMFRTNGKAMAMNEVEGFVKLIVDADNRIILGAHIIGAHASDLIQELTAMINSKASIDDLKNTIHAHPTLGEVIHDVAEQF